MHIAERALKLHGSIAHTAKFNVNVRRFAIATTTKKIAIISTLIIAITILHYLGGDYHSPIHDFYKLLYLFPIILSGLFFGFKGGVITSVISSLFHSPFVLLTLSAIRSDNYYDFLDIIIFLSIGMITGIFSQKKDQRLSEFEFELNRQKLLENYSNNVIESIKSGVVAVNNDSLITMINKSASKILNCGEQYCIGQAIGEILPQCKSYIDFSLNENKIQENIELDLSNSGRKYIIKMGIFPLNFESVSKGLVVIIEDITELRSLQSQILRNEKFTALGELSAGIAHEIRNPLAIIKAIGQTMRQEIPDHPEIVKELKIIDEEVERANKVVKELMEFGKPPKNEFAACSINEILKEVLTISNKYLSLHNIDIKFVENNTSQIWADKAQLKQAFINIIFNGTQAMLKGGTLTISTSDQNGHYVKTVIEDTGEGIPEENLERVFYPFFTTKDQGTGLGLSIVQRIIEEHRGIITIRSKEKQGTIVEILMPRLQEGESE